MRFSTRGFTWMELGVVVAVLCAANVLAGCEQKVAASKQTTAPSAGQPGALMPGAPPGGMGARPAMASPGGLMPTGAPGTQPAGMPGTPPGGAPGAPR